MSLNLYTGLTGKIVSQVQLYTIQSISNYKFKDYFCTVRYIHS